MPEEAKSKLPSKKSLENYASAYMGAYLNAVEKERPEHAPPLARNAPYEIEVCLMPNACFVMLFDRAEKQNITVAERDWHYVESKVMSGVAHMVTVYAHETPTVADAIARGKKDAVRDIRSLEDSSLSKAVAQLEKVLGDLTSVEKGNKSLLKIAEMELSKLQPIKDAIKNAGPEVDMLGMVDALRNYPTAPVEVSVDIKERQLLESITKELGDLSDVIRRVESQDQKLEEIEQSMTKSLSEFHRSVDEKIGKGLAVVLSSSDRKIDKGLAAIQEAAGQAVKSQQDNGSVKDLERRMAALEQALNAVQERPDVSKEVLNAVVDLRGTVDRLSARTTRIEQYLMQLSKRAPPPPTR
jgi:hypothetical protein